MSQIFRPEWLNNPELIPIIDTIYSFTKEHGTPPNLPVLHSIFEKDNPEAYKTRFRPALNRIAELAPTPPEILYTLSQVRDVAVVRSFQDVASNQAFMESQADYNGKNMLRALSSWLNKFSSVSDEETLDIKSAIRKLVERQGLDNKQVRIPVGIKVFDEWTNGGLRTQNLGIIMAPSGAGKSALLMNMAYRAANSLTDTWFITNELTMTEQSERFLSRMTGKQLELIENDPVIGYKGLDHYWSFGFDSHLFITALNKEVDAADLEAIMDRQSNLLGWKPKLIVLDFMERLKPIDSGYNRDNTSMWLGAVAKDLLRMAKRHNQLIWTAAQTNRSGLNADQMDSEMLQGSIRHLQECSALIAARQVFLGMKDMEEERIGLEFFDLKARSAKRHSKSRVVEVNLSTMLITNQEVDSSLIHKNEALTEDPDDDRVTVSVRPRKSTGNNGNGKSKRRML
jgi:replicative DNA helicase